MAEQGAKLWKQGNGSFAQYAERAVTAGVVKTQPIKERVGEFWIKLRVSSFTIYDSFNLADTPHQSRYMTPLMPPPLRQPSDRFIPLLQFIRNCGHLEPLCSLVVGELLKLQPPPFIRGEWSTYLREAQELGLVKNGSRAFGQQWIEIAVRDNSLCSTPHDVADIYAAIGWRRYVELLIYRRNDETSWTKTQIRRLTAL